MINSSTSLVSYLNAMTSIDLIADCPSLTKLVEETSLMKGVREWIAKRPQNTH